MAELLSRISSAELTEWQAFYELEPFGSQVDNLYRCMTTAAIYNVNRDSKKTDAFTPEMFMLGGAYADAKRNGTTYEGENVVEGFKQLALIYGDFINPHSKTDRR